jgi:hypothetical protein
MADVVVTERETYSHGKFKGEIGRFQDLAGDFTLKTKLGRIVWFRPQASGTGTDGTYDGWWNYSDAGTTVDGGRVFFTTADLSGTAFYNYLAIGTG